MHSDYNDEERGFFQRFGFPIGIGAVGAVVAVLVLGHHSSGPPARTLRPPDVVMIRPMAPTPPPPTPPPEPPKEMVQKMVEQTPMDKPEDKPQDAPKEAPGGDDERHGQRLRRLRASSARRRERGLGRRIGGAQSRFGWYAGQVQRSVQEALSRNRITALAGIH